MDSDIVSRRRHHSWEIRRRYMGAVQRLHCHDPVGVCASWMALALYIPGDPVDVYFPCVSRRDLRMIRITSRRPVIA